MTTLEQDSDASVAFWIIRFLEACCESGGNKTPNESTDSPNLGTSNALEILKLRQAMVIVPRY